MGDKRRILVAMSGGVDSSTTAWLLKEEGHDVAGAFMSRSAGIPACEQARRVADHLGIPFHVLDLTEDFELLVDYFCSEYLRGRTPNPCAICNPQIKFRRLLEEADRQGREFLATGHYARVERADGRVNLRRGLDPAKDQSYYLFALSQAQLGRSMFPLGERTKGEVRELARKAGLPAAETEESQDICFVPDRDYARLVRERLGPRVRPGEIVDVDGKVVGTHDGIVGFTIGQRRGVGVAMGEPVYVVDIDPRANRVVIGPADRLLVSEFEAHNVNWLVPGMSEGPAKPLSCGVQIRYNSTPKRATVTPSGRFGPSTSLRALSESSSRNGVHVAFDEPQRAVTPGQCAVFYDSASPPDSIGTGYAEQGGDTVLGGGWISGK